MTSVVLRAATAADSPAVRSLIHAALIEHGLTPEPDGTDADLADIEASYRDGHFWVLERAGDIIGSCALYPRGQGTVELRKMYLARAARGAGHGRRLLEHALAVARADGYRRVRLETASVLQEAIAMYERYGFTRQAQAPDVPRCDQTWALDL